MPAQIMMVVEASAVLDEPTGSVACADDSSNISMREISNELTGEVSAKKEVLIPLVEDFILSVNSETRVISMLLPQGLLEL